MAMALPVATAAVTSAAAASSIRRSTARVAASSAATAVASLRRGRRYLSTYEPAAPLHHEWVVDGRVLPPGETPPPAKNGERGTVLFLHGLLGSGKNLRGPAKRLTKDDGGLAALLVDLRGHGSTSALSSSSGRGGATLSPPHTLEACAEDVIGTARSLGLVGDGRSPVGVVGHSFGGRVALEYAAMAQAGGSSADVRPPRASWILDSVPGSAHGSVADVVNAVSAVPIPIPSKNHLVEDLTKNRGVDKAIAMWMTTNLTKSDCGNGFRFAFDLNVALEVLDEFPRQDYAGRLRAAAGGRMGGGTLSSGRSSVVNVVMAGKNGAWTDDVVAEVEAVGRDVAGRVRSHRLPNAGHWVHVDDLDGLMGLMEGSFG